MSKYKILSAILLLRLTEKFPNLVDKTNLFIGNSAGSFIALGLASGLSPKEIVQFFQKYSSRIFADPKPKVGQIARPKYNNNNLISALESVFDNNLSLRDLNSKVLITSFSLKGQGLGPWEPVFFNNYKRSSNIDERVIDVALSSSAAPTYFPSYQGHVDGGVFANNPSTAGISFAVDKMAGNKKLENITLLSIGTGAYPLRISQDTTKWGECQWMGLFGCYVPKPHEPKSPLTSILFDGVIEADNTYSSQLLNKRFFRLNPTLKTNIELDDVTKIPELIRMGENTNLNNTYKFIRNEYLR